MSTQSVGNGANPYYEGLHDAEDEQDMRNRLALVHERDTLRAQLAAAETRAERLDEAVDYVLRIFIQLEKAGHRTADPKFAIQILSKASAAQSIAATYGEVKP